MKNNLCLFFLFFINVCFAQNIKAIYTRTDLSAIGDDTKISNKRKPSLHSYEYSNGKSIYKIYSSIKSFTDTVNMVTDGFEHQSVHRIILPTEDTYYKDIKNNIYRRELSIDGETFSVKDKLEQFNWTITKEKATIKGYKCRKGTMMFKDKYFTYAWFCEDIPINDGPVFFWGLPGLIIEINIDEKYVVSLTDLKVTKEDILIKEPVNKTKMTTAAEVTY